MTANNANFYEGVVFVPFKQLHLAMKQAMKTYPNAWIIPYEWAVEYPHVLMDALRWQAVHVGNTLLEPQRQNGAHIELRNASTEYYRWNVYRRDGKVELHDTTIGRRIGTTVSAAEHQIGNTVMERPRRVIWCTCEKEQKVWQSIEFSSNVEFKVMDQRVLDAFQCPTEDAVYG